MTVGSFALGALAVYTGYRAVALYMSAGVTLPVVGWAIVTGILTAWTVYSFYQIIFLPDENIPGFDQIVPEPNWAEGMDLLDGHPIYPGSHR